MFGISPEYYPWLAGVAALFVCLFAFLAYRIMKNPYLRRTSQSEFLPEPRSAQQVEFETVVPKMARAVRTDEMSKAEILAMLKLTAAMAGYGPMTTTAKHSPNYGKIRTKGVDFIKPGVYRMFLNAFRSATSISEDNPTDDRPLSQITGYSLDQLAERDEVLALMVMYAPSIAQFYEHNADVSRFTAEFAGGPAIKATIAKFNFLHREFYLLEG